MTNQSLCEGTILLLTPKPAEPLKGKCALGPFLSILMI
jgi:hypothetical protein